MENEMYHQTTYVPATTNHVLHLLLTLFTCGAWGLVWIIVAAANANRTVPVTTWAQTPYTPSRPVGAYPPPGTEVSRMADGGLQWGYSAPAMWEKGHGEQHQVPPRVQSPEA
jgi:hypothetical protein